MSTTGVRIGHESYDSVPAEAQVRPLRNQLIIEPIPWPFSNTIEVVYTGRPLRGKVRATGPGTYPKRYDGPKGKRTRSWPSKQFRPCDVQVGDIVQLGGLSLGGYLFTTFRWGDKECVVCTEDDVTAIEDT